MRKLLALMLLLALPAWPQQSEVVKVRIQPDLKPNLASFPRVEPGPGVTPEIAAIVNRRLARLDADALSSWKDCRQRLRQAHQDGGYERAMSITMRGPRFLSMYAGDTYDCASAHTEDSTLALVYDLQTGLPINWLTYLPGSRADTDSGPHSTRTSFVVWPPLQQLALAQAEEECKSSFRGPDAGEVDFTLWLQGNGGIVFYPILTPHITSALCAKAVEIDQPTARKLGVSPTLLDILAAAAKTKQ